MVTFLIQVIKTGRQSSLKADLMHGSANLNGKNFPKDYIEMTGIIFFCGKLFSSRKTFGKVNFRRKNSVKIFIQLVERVKDTFIFLAAWSLAFCSHFDTRYPCTKTSRSTKEISQKYFIVKK